MDRDELATAIVRISELRGSFKLRSGAMTDTYFDKYRFEANPLLLREIARALAPKVPPGAEALAGLELGGIPIATMLGQETGLPVRFVRKEAKRYGTALLAEGGPVDGARLCIVEDVVTSGGQILLSVADLRTLGAKIDTALCCDRPGVRRRRSPGRPGHRTARTLHRPRPRRRSLGNPQSPVGHGPSGTRARTHRVPEGRR